MKKKFLIIGSGISSLTMAILLLREGHQVTILEQHYLPGGFLHCFKRFGFKFETGAHYVGALGEDLPFYRLLNYLGVYHAEDFVELDTPNIDTYYFEGHEFSYGIGYQENIRRLTNAYPSEKEKIEKFFFQIQESAQTFPTYYFKTEYDQKRMLRYLDITLDQVLSDLGIEGQLRSILEAPCILHGVSPKEVSFGIHSILIDSITVSSHGFKNGGDGLANRFVDKIKSLGGEIKLSHKVTKITLKDQLISGVICDNGETFVADEYVSGIHPKLLFDMIGQENLKLSFRNRLNKISESSSFVGAYVTLKDSLQIDPRANYFFVPENRSYRESDIDLKNQFGFFATPKRDYTGEGKFPLSIHASCPTHYFDKWKNSGKKITDPEYLKAKEDIFIPLFNKIDQRFKGFSDSIVDISYSSSLTNSRFNPSPNGSAYGFYHDLSITGARCVGPQTHFANLYLTGQNCLFPGILGAAISGLRTCAYFTGISNILRNIQYES